MALNTNIALGVQPVQQQPNMLAQMGQLMALRAAQQETEGYEGVRGAIAGGMDPADPRLLQYGKRGVEAFRAAGEGRVKQQDALTKAYVNQRKSLDFVTTPDELLAHGLSQFNDPIIAPQLKAQGLTPEKLTASFQKQLATDGFENLLKKRAMGLDDWYKELMQTERTRISAAAPLGQLELAKKRDARDQAQLDLVRDILTGGATTPTTLPVAGGGVPMGGGGPAVAPVAAPMGGGPAAAPVAGAPVNALTPQPAAAPAPVNALAPQPGMPGVPAEVAQLDSQIGQLIRVGTPQALNAVNTLVARRNILMPTQQVVQNKQGVYQILDQRTGVSRPVIGADGQPLQGKVTPLPYESTYDQKVGSAAGERDVALVRGAEDAVDKLITINDTLAQLQSSDAITGFGANVLKDVERFRAQFLADKTAGKRVADTEILNAMLGSEVFGMIQSLGIGARGLDTPAEREYLREVMTGTVTMDKEALIKLTKIRKNVIERAIDKYNEKVKKGDLNKFFETQGIAPRTIEKPVAPAAPAAASAEAPPPGLPPEIAELWKYMPPEDRKLWQK